MRAPTFLTKSVDGWPSQYGRPPTNQKLRCLATNDKIIWPILVATRNPGKRRLQTVHWRWLDSICCFSERRSLLFASEPRIRNPTSKFYGLRLATAANNDTLRWNKLQKLRCRIHVMGYAYVRRKFWGLGQDAVHFSVVTSNNDTVKWHISNKTTTYDP